MCDSTYEQLLREYQAAVMSSPDSLIYSYETAQGLNDSYYFTIDNCQAFTLSTSKIYSTVKEFKEFVKKFFKKLNLNALIYGVCERHPNRKGIHMHFILMAKEKLSYLKYKGIYLFETAIKNICGALAYVKYMFKEKPIKSIFSKYNLYEEAPSEKNSEEKADDKEALQSYCESVEDITGRISACMANAGECSNKDEV